MLMVSVIVPNYNHAPYLKKRIESVLIQTYENFEVIILDDWSSDNSKEIIEKFRGHPKVSHIVYNEINSGSTFKQWQRGIALAKGEWVWIAESDDYCEINFLQKMLEKIDKNDVISYSNSYAVDENNKVLDKGLNNATWLKKEVDRSRFLKNFRTTGVEEIKNFLIYNNVIYNASAAVFRKESGMSALKDLGQFRLYGDWLFWILLALQGNIRYHARPLNFFRNHTTNVRSQSNKNPVYFAGECYKFRKKLSEILKNSNSFDKNDITVNRKCFIDELASFSKQGSRLNLIKRMKIYNYALKRF